VGTVLVLCRNSNIRKFYVDNLTVRGYTAIGMRSMSDSEADLSTKYVSNQGTPELVLMWGDLARLQPDIEKIRQLYVRSLPIIVVSPEKPDKAWMVKWDIAAHRSGLSDSRQLMGFLHHWLV
jgi:hypothetical protein